jgi:DNA-binding transcriptional regulator YiaG
MIQGVVNRKVAFYCDKRYPPGWIKHGVNAMAPKPTKELRFKSEMLRALRAGAGMSGQELARRMSTLPECAAVNKQQVSRWETGQTRPDLAAALALEAIFGVPVSDWYRRI